MLLGWSGIAVACCLVVGKDPSLNEPLRQVELRCAVLQAGSCSNACSSGSVERCPDPVASHEARMQPVDSHL